MGNPTFPCESCGTFHSASEVSDAGGYCPQCDADYDERKMFSDLVSRYATLEAENAKLRAELERLVPDVSAMARVLSDRAASACCVDPDDNWKVYGQEFIDDVRAMLAAAPSAPKADDPVKVQLLEALEKMLTPAVRPLSGNTLSMSPVKMVAHIEAAIAAARQEGGKV